MRLDALIECIAATVLAFDEHQAGIARDAFARYGKDRHQAGLNFGDCAV
jgi:ribonuclease VapC